MGVVLTSPSICSLSSGLFSSTRRVCPEHARGGFDRGDFVSAISGPSLFCSEEEHRQASCDSRPVDPEQVDPMPFFQDDDSRGRMSSPVSGILHHIDRSQGRVLARPHSSLFPEILGFSSGEQEVSLQGDAFWPQHRSSDIHQVVSANSSGIKDEGSKSTRLLGRLVGVGGLRTRLSSFHRYCPSGSSEKRFFDQFSEVPSYTSETVPMAGSSMEHCLSEDISPSGESGGHHHFPSGVLPQEGHLQKTSGKVSREASVCFPSGPYRQSPSQIPQPSPSGECSQKEEGHFSSSTHASQKESGEMASPGSSLVRGPLSSSCSFLGRLYRRLLGGVGGPDLRRYFSERQLVSSSEPLPYQHPGTCCGTHSSEQVAYSTGLACSDSFRQCHYGGLSEQEGISQISSFEFVGPVDSPPASEEESRDYGISHSGGAERSSGRSVEVSSGVLGMDTGQGVFPVHLFPAGNSGCRPLCHERERSTPSLCVANSGQSGHSHGRFYSGLVGVEEHLLVSTNQVDSQVSQSPGVLQGARAPVDSNVAGASLVPPRPVQGQGVHSVAESFSIPADWREAYFLQVKNTPPISLLGIMKDVYSRLYSAESAEILLKSLRLSTCRQYQSIWNSFCSFVASNEFDNISTETVLSFLRFSFNVKGYAPATVSAYRSALAKPLRVIFDIDVSKEPFNEFVKALFNIRPNVPSKRVLWSLDKVLQLALSSRFQRNPSKEDLFMLTLFLMALATGSRISELHALARSDELIEFSEEGVTLYPNPDFLAKNEDPQFRRNPLFIARLKDERGGNHPLCPVHNLSLYLDSTSCTKSFNIFVHPISLQDISIHKLRLALCKFIRLGDSNAFPKAHDLRKTATSYAFFKGMSSSQLCDLVGWSSIQVFKRHYLKQIDEISSPLVVLGTVVNP